MNRGIVRCNLYEKYEYISETTKDGSSENCFTKCFTKQSSLSFKCRQRTIEDV